MEIPITGNYLFKKFLLCTKNRSNYGKSIYRELALIYRLLIRQEAGVTRANKVLYCSRFIVLIIIVTWSSSTLILASRELDGGHEQLP